MSNVVKSSTQMDSQRLHLDTLTVLSVGCFDDVDTPVLLLSAASSDKGKLEPVEKSISCTEPSCRQTTWCTGLYIRLAQAHLSLSAIRRSGQDNSEFQHTLNAAINTLSRLSRASVPS